MSCAYTVVNIATQKLISTHSKSDFVGEQETSSNDYVASGRDVVGLIRAIAVKVFDKSRFFKYLSNLYLQVRSSSKRKELFFEVQRLQSNNPLTLLIDVATRWSSTFLMLLRAENLQSVSHITASQHWLIYF